MKTSITNIARRLGWLKGSIRVLLLYAVLCVIGFCQFGCAYAQLKGATINNRTARRGEPLGIEVTREGEQITPELGLNLEKGDEIKTPSGVTALIRFGDGSEVIMMPDTKITIESIRVWFGKVIARIKGRFKAKTEYVTAGVRSTLFIMTVDQNFQSTLEMVEGSVLLTSNENRWPSIPLQSGQEASILRSQRPEVETMPLYKYNKILRFINETTQSIKGPDAKVFVPKVVGLSNLEAEVEDVLGSAGFRIGKVTKTIEGDYSIGTVVRQQPESGKELRRGGSVDIWVRAREVIVPNVVGRHRNAAMEIIRSEGLSIHEDIRETITGKYEPGVVNAQSPVAGQRKVEGTAIRLTVEADYSIVPDVKGMSVEQADSLVRQRRLIAHTTDSGLDPDIQTPQVVRQEPAPGNRVKPGTTVTLHVASPGVRVPNLIGRNEREAPNILSRMNLRTGRISREYHQRYPAVVVTNQYPAAGQVVKPGSTVNLTVSSGPQIRVPNLIGLREDAARKILTSKNLRVQVVYKYHKDYSASVVWYQSPAAGQPITPGSVVTITVSVIG